jgi:drug/metabolite transporter (DMT)-like permease
MTTAAFLLVLASALCHSTWNLLLKRSTHKVSFLACAGAFGAAVFFIPALIAAISEGIGRTAVALGLVTACLHSLYGLSLARGYRLGDLSAVYPVSRGTGLALIPILAVVLLDESISSLAWVGIALVFAGVYAVHLDPRAPRDLLAPLRSLNGPAGRAALITGAIISAYSLWDKNALDEVTPLVLNQFAMTGHLAILVPLLLVDGGRLVKAQWSESRLAIFSAGILIALAYVLVLLALQTSNVSYVAPSREIGIVFGAFFGSSLLAEGSARMRITAAGLIAFGVIVLAIAP